MGDQHLVFVRVLLWFVCVWDQHPAKAYRKLPTILCYKFPDYVPPHQILLLSNLISIFIIHDMRVQYEAFYIYLTNRYKGAQVLENGLAHLQTYCPIWLRLALVCRGHKYQIAITHKIYSLRGSFPKLTNSLSPKMYSCLIKNEKIY